MNYKPIITIYLLLLSFGSLSAQSDTDTRSYFKTVPIGKESSLEISNKYGNVYITSWDKDSASIRAEVKAYASNRSKLDRMFEGITIKITDSKYVIRATTEFTQNISMLFESFKGMTSKLISYDSRVEINYYINIPDYLSLNIENKYGDVYMENNTGKFSVTVSNGSFKANSLGKGSSINLTFCDATINSVISGKVNASFSDIFIGNTEDIDVNSTSSKYNIRDAGLIRIESRRDKYFIDNIENLEGDSYFTDFKMARIKTKLDLSTRYGSINADLVDKGFEIVNINSGYSDISLEFETGSSYNFDIRHINAFLVLPEKNIKSEKKVLNEEKKEYMTFGTIGKIQEYAKVKIDATRGNIYIK